MGWLCWGRKPPKLDLVNNEVPPPDPYMQWVPVDDHLPEVSHRKLFLWNGSYMRYGRYLACDMGGRICQFFDDYDCPINGRKITHYMYIPEPPEAK